MKRFLVLLLVFFSFPVFAGEFRTGEHVYIDRNVDGDLYGAGGEVVARAPVGGDLVVLGGEVRVDDLVGGDLIAGGGKLRINHTVGDDIRVAGGEISLEGGAGGDVILLGGSLDVAGDMEIGGDLVLAGGNVRSAAKVGGKAYIAGGNIQLGGEIDGPLYLEGDTVHLEGHIRGDVILHASSTLTIGRGAIFDGTVRYNCDEGEVDFGNSVPRERLQFDPDLRITEEKSSEGSMGLFGFLFFSSGFLMIWLYLMIPGSGVERISGIVGNRFLTGLGAGFLYVLLVPPIMLLLGITIVGLPLALLMGSIFFYSLFFATSFSSLVLAILLRSRMGKDWGRGMLFLVGAGIYLGLVVLNGIPVLGLILNGILTLGILGGVILFVQESWKGTGGT